MPRAHQTRTIAIDARKLLDFGIGTYIRGLVRALSEQKVESRHQLEAPGFRFVLLIPPGVETESVLGTLPEHFSTVEEPAAVYSFQELFSVSKTLRKVNADLYHATHYVLPFGPPCPTVATVHDLIHLLFPEFFPNKAALFYAKFMLQRTVRLADRIVTVSQNSAVDLVQQLQADKTKIDIVPNGVDEAFRDRVSPGGLSDILELHGLKPGYILFVGNPKPHKNLNRVLRAFATAKQETEENEEEGFPQLVCVGAGESAAMVAERACSLGIRDSVRLPTWVEQEHLPAIYQGAQFLLFPGLYEGFGLPVVEAMASGTPVITSANSALAEVAGDAAHLVDPTNTAEIGRALTMLLASPEEKERLSNLGVARSKQFSWAAAAAQTSDVYRKVLAESAK